LLNYVAKHIQRLLKCQAHRSQRLPPLIRLAQEAGCVTLDPQVVDILTERVVPPYRENTLTIVERVAETGAPLLVVTPIGQLGMEPYGPLSTARALYEEGAAQSDPVARNRLWVQARDAELFTSDLRTKTPMLDVLRQLGPAPAPGLPLSVCDIETRFVQEGQPFDATHFADPLHFTDAGYALLTGAIADCLVAGPLAPVAAEVPSSDEAASP